MAKAATEKAVTEKAVTEKAAKKAKSVKEKKQPKPHDWLDSKEKGAVLYITSGKAIVMKEDETHYLMRVDGTDEQKAIPKTSTRTKAFNEEYRDKYKQSETRTPSGSKSVSCGDAMATALNGLTVQQLKDVATKAGLGDRFKKWEHLNPGMVRMNLGNVMRAAMNENETSERVGVAIQAATKMGRTPPPEKKVKVKKDKKVKVKKDKMAVPTASSKNPPTEIT